MGIVIAWADVVTSVDQMSVGSNDADPSFPFKNPEWFGVAHALPAMVLFFLFILLPLFFSIALMAFVALCKPGCAVSTADTSSV